MAFHLEIVTPEKTLFSGEVEHLRAPGSEGSFGVLTGHEPLLSGLQMGRISFRETGRVDVNLATSGGFVEVQPTQLTILAETAEFGEEIDVVRAESARDRARAHLAQEQDVDATRATAALERALNRLRVSGSAAN